jgi:hypothetical protein
MVTADRWVARGGICQFYHQRWDRFGRPDLDAWVADPPGIVQPAPGAGLPDRSLPALAASGVAVLSCSRRHLAGPRPAVEEFIAVFVPATVTEDERIHLDRLRPQLRFEMQYVLQCRHDERRTKTQPPRRDASGASTGRDAGDLLVGPGRRHLAAAGPLGVQRLDVASTAGLCPPRDR